VLNGNTWTIYLFTLIEW